MPQFVLDRGSEGAAFVALDQFMQGYIEALFWTESGEPDSACYGCSLDDLSAELTQQIIEDCKEFQELAHDDLQAAYRHESIAYDANHAGVDFWLTRNGHGAGFWDRGFGGLRTDTVGGRLSRDAKYFGERCVYRGDDGMIYC